jgi:hypothetical protein
MKRWLLLENDRSPPAPQRHARLLVAALFAVVAVTTGSCQATDDALLIGRLYGDASVGCVWVGRPRGGLEVDWPFAVSIQLDPVRVSGPGFIAQEGDWFRLVGGTRPDVPVTEGCPVPEPESGKFVAGSVSYFGDERPADETGTLEP